MADKEEREEDSLMAKYADTFKAVERMQQNFDSMKQAFHQNIQDLAVKVAVNTLEERGPHFRPTGNLDDYLEDAEDEDDDAEWNDRDPDFDNDDEGDWADMELNEDGQQLIPIPTHKAGLSLAKVLESINLPPDTNLDEIPEDVLSRLVEKLPAEIYDELHAKFGDKVEREKAENEQQAFRHKLPNVFNLLHLSRLLHKACNILVLCGAGISTANNILYDRQQTSESQKSYDLQHFMKDPNLFYKRCDDGPFTPAQSQLMPTKTHYFLKALQDQHKLHRIHTQNIDGLELKAGICDTKINHCHGTTSSYSCVNCLFTVASSSDFIKQHMKHKSVAYCIKCREDVDRMIDFRLNHKDIISEGMSICWEEKDDFTNVARIRIPRLLVSEFKRRTNFLRLYPHSLQYSITADTHCAMMDIMELRHDDDEVLQDLKRQILKWLSLHPSFGALKPNAVFFGESLKTEALTLIDQDAKDSKIDLVFVVGTAMVVDPFASIPNLLNKNIPLILINPEVVGRSRYEFDINLLGNCDDICETLLYQMKWDYDYSSTVCSHSYQYVPPNCYLFKGGKVPTKTQQSMLMDTGGKMKTIREEEDNDDGDEAKQQGVREWRVGDRVKYRQKQTDGPQRQSNDEWHSGCGVIVDLFTRNQQRTIRLKLRYGIMQFKMDEIEITMQH